MKQLFIITALFFSLNCHAQKEKFYFNRPVQELHSFTDTILKYFPAYKYTGVDTIDMKMTKLKYTFKQNENALIVKFANNDEYITAEYPLLINFLQDYANLKIDELKAKQMGHWQMTIEGYDYVLNRVANSEKGYWTFSISKNVW